MIKFNCDGCGSSLKVSEGKAGKRGKCPTCGRIVTVPAPTYGLADALADEAASGTSAGAAGPTATAPGAAAAAAAAAKPAGISAVGGVRCPSCSRPLGAGFKICVQCGVRVPSGRPILMRRDIDEDVVEGRTEAVVKPLSWILPFGLYPITSEAIGRSKPYVTWALAAITVAISAWFWLAGADSSRPKWINNLMLWPNKEGQIEIVDYDTYREILFEEYGHDVSEQEIQAQYSQDKQLLASMGGFHWHQLITHAFLHGDILHLAGNLVFLLVFGRAIGAALGNVGTLVVYLLLAVLAGWIHLLNEPADSITPMLGASGALMGLAGMYAVLFPLHRVYMVIWLRMGLLVGFRLARKIFPVWGVLVVCFYIVFDVIYVALKLETGVAHWAHMGGFMAGAGVALLLLAARAVHTGGDAFSLILGRWAWPLVGAPAGRVGNRGFWGIW